MFGYVVGVMVKNLIKKRCGNGWIFATSLCLVSLFMCSGAECRLFLEAEGGAFVNEGEDGCTFGSVNAV